jgi:hypothetical protein
MVKHMKHEKVGDQFFREKFWKFVKRAGQRSKPRSDLRGGAQTISNCTHSKDDTHKTRRNSASDVISLVTLQLPLTLRACENIYGREAPSGRKTCDRFRPLFAK